MECSEARKRLDELVTGDLYGTEAARVLLHVRRCYLCREEYDELKELMKDCRARLRHPAPVDRFDLLMARINAEHRAAGPAPAREGRQTLAALWLFGGGRRLVRVMSAAAAAAALALSLGPRPSLDYDAIPVLSSAWSGRSRQVIEPASAAVESLFRYRFNIEQYLETLPNAPEPGPQPPSDAVAPGEVPEPVVPASAAPKT